MLSELKTAALFGIEAHPVEVQVDIGAGIPAFHLVGLPMGPVREGSVRIRAALANSGFDLGNVRVTVNLAPADMRKDGSAFDLPIALGALEARGLITVDRRDLLFAGELSLSGRLQPVRGGLPLAEAARHLGLGGILLPRANAAEAAHVEGIAAYGVDTLSEAIEFVTGARDIAPTAQVAPVVDRFEGLDFGEVTGQLEARRAAEVCAAGGHNLLLYGPPGAGKTMIARRIAPILPPLVRQEAIETTKIHSVAGLLREGQSLIARRPFRAPHHTCSSVGLVGGGPNPKPGEVSLGHNGVLFLDELPEFQRGSLEGLRQPLEDGEVTIVRAQQSVLFPSRFMLVAAMNPCPCGYRGSEIRTCTCGERQAARYRSRISGPLLDRFDVFVRVQPVSTSDLLEGSGGEGSEAIAVRVGAARERQRERFAKSRIHCNAQMNGRQIRRYVKLDAPLRTLMEEYATAQSLSARALHRVCRVARTIADLAGREDVGDEDIWLALTMQQARWL